MRLLPRLAGFALALLLSLPASTVTIDWVTVGNPGNAADADTGFGAVADVYRISATEVTNAQYAEFLNAVAETDTNGLYNASMRITRSGSSGSFSYSARAGREAMPVSFVSFYDSLRFANWLHNGQLSGAQDATTTEDGAYTITQQGIDDNSITRNEGATIFLTSEDEWYKAAYHNALGLPVSDYFDYPAGFDAQTSCTAPGATPNTANCDNAVGDLTGVGSYTGSSSPYGTFDQGGNVWEWNEAIRGPLRGIRGGSFVLSPLELAASSRSDDFPSRELAVFGFRVAMVPEPGTGLLLTGGLLVLTGWRRARK